jgi:hypothetical protein
MDYLTFDANEVADGISTLEAMASTSAEQHPAVMAEVQQVLDWARQRFRIPTAPSTTAWTGTTTFR